MLRAVTLYLLLAAAPQAGWKSLSAEGLSLMAPPATTLESAPNIDAARTWWIRNPGFTITVDAGAWLGDSDDAEPALCYTAEPIVVDGHDAILRTTKRAARLDCPENYASLFIASNHAGGKAFALSVRVKSRDDFATIRAVIASVHFARW